MSILAEVHSYWSGNSTLNTALAAAGKVWTGLAPETVSFPFAVIVPIGMVPSPTTGTGYVENFVFQISIYDTDPDNVDSLANTVAGQFDYQAISEATISCERTDGPTFMVDPDSPERVYHAVITYELRENKTLPNN